MPKSLAPHGGNQRCEREWLPQRVRAEDSVCEGNELAHNGDEATLGCLPRSRRRVKKAAIWGQRIAQRAAMYTTERGSTCPVHI